MDDGNRGGAVSIGRRIAHLYDVTVNALLGRAADPREALDYSYREQQDLLLRLRRDLAEVAATRMRAGRQESQLRHTAAQLERQAQLAASAGQEEAARRQLALRTATLARAGELEAGEAGLRDDEEKLSVAVNRLRARIDAFAVHKEAVRARYTQAESAGNASQLSGEIWAELDRVHQAIRRAEDVTTRIEARASALGSLLAAGGVTGATGLAGDDEIRSGVTRARVEAELARLKDQLRSAAGQGRTGSAPGGRGRPRT